MLMCHFPEIEDGSARRNHPGLDERAKLEDVGGCCGDDASPHSGSTSVSCDGVRNALRSLTHAAWTPLCPVVT